MFKDDFSTQREYMNLVANAQTFFSPCEVVIEQEKEMLVRIAEGLY